MRTISIENMTLEVGRPKIAVPITGKNHEEIVEQCEALMKLPCDMLEWRVDEYLSAIDNLEEKIDNNEVHLELIRILDDIDYITNGMPVIFTIRTSGEGGKVSLDKVRIHDLASLAAQSQLIDFVDIELFDENDALDEVYMAKRINEIHEFGVKVIMSYHDFDELPSDDEIINIISAMRALGGDISKIATKVTEKNQAVNMLKIARDMTAGDQAPVIMIAMGKEGLVSRIAGGKFGSVITFAAGAEATAPGQLNVTTLDRLLGEYYSK